MKECLCCRKDELVKILPSSSKTVTLLLFLKDMFTGKLCGRTWILSRRVHIYVLWKQVSLEYTRVNIPSGVGKTWVVQYLLQLSGPLGTAAALFVLCISFVGDTLPNVCHCDWVGEHPSSWSGHMKRVNLLRIMIRHSDCRSPAASSRALVTECK